MLTCGSVDHILRHCCHNYYPQIHHIFPHVATPLVSLGEGRASQKHR